MKISTRPKSDSDKDFARKTHHEALLDVVVRQFGEWDEQRQDGFFEQNWTDPTLEILLCDDVPCGYCSIEQHAGRIEVRELIILPDFQNRRIGSTFLRQIMDRAAAGRNKVTLQVLHQNRAVEFYRRLGFTDCGRTDNHLRMEWNTGC